MSNALKAIIGLISQQSDSGGGPLTFKRAVGEISSANVRLIQSGTVSGTEIYYKTQDQDWTAYTFGTMLFLESDDDYIQFWNKTETLSTSNDYVYFEIFGYVSASGNVNSMINFSKTLTDYCYANMFQNCTGLTALPELPATTLANNCYANMFQRM